MPAFCIENDEKLGMGPEFWHGPGILVWTRNFGMDPEFWYGPGILVWAWKFGMGLKVWYGPGNETLGPC